VTATTGATTEKLEGTSAVVVTGNDPFLRDWLHGFPGLLPILLSTSIFYCLVFFHFLVSCGSLSWHKYVSFSAHVQIATRLVSWGILPFHPPSLARPSLLLHPRFTHPLPFSCFSLPSHSARRFGEAETKVATVPNEKNDSHAFKSKRGPNTLGPHNLQSWTERVTRVPRVAARMPVSIPTKNFPSVWGDLGPHVINGSLGSTSWTASQLVQPFLQGTWAWPTDRTRYNACSNRHSHSVYVMWANNN